MASSILRTLIAAAVAAVVAAAASYDRITTARADASIAQAAVPQSAGPSPQELAAVRVFEQRVGDYAILHRLLEGPLPPVPITRDMRAVREATDALAHRIQEARKTAHQGDIFSPEVVPMFRRRIATSLTPEDIDAILNDREEVDPIVVPRLQVNGRWPEAMPFNFVPPQLIAALPRLPEELQYRIIGRSLVLWDLHANLIVDFLPAAFTT